MHQNAWFPLSDLIQPRISVGGMCTLYCLPISEITQWPEINPATGYLSGKFILATGAEWIRLKGIDKNRTFSEETKESDAGNYIETQLKIFIPEDSPALRYTLNQLRYRELAVVLKERNGQMKLIGNAWHGALLAFNYNTGDADGQRGYNTSFARQSVDTSGIFDPVYQSIEDLTQLEKAYSDAYSDAYA